VIVLFTGCCRGSMSALGHERTSHLLIRHVRFRSGTRPREAKRTSAPKGWPLVQAICDFVHDRVSFGYAYANPTRTAFYTFTEGAGRVP
jgi:hypothetical protein